MPITPESVRIHERLLTELRRTTDATTRRLVAAWVLAWDEVSADLFDSVLELTSAGNRVSRAALMRSIRLRKSLAVIGERLEDLGEQAGVTITGPVGGIVDQAARTQSLIIDAQLPVGQPLIDVTSWARVDAAAIDAIVRRSTEQITSRLVPLSEDAYDVMVRELIRGIAAGSNPRDTAKRIVKRAEGGFNGGLSRAMRVARTETLDAHRAGAQYGQNRHTDVLTGWMWNAVLSPDTCPACVVMHGQVFGPETPGPAGHPNCRCSRMPKTKTWAELGFDLDEPDDGIVTDSRTWFDALPREDQVRLMGAERLRMLDAGLVEWDELAQVVRAPEWRDFMQVTPLRTLRRKARRQTA